MGCLTCFLFWVISPLVALKVWLKLSTGWCRSNVSLVGKTAIVTGANIGIGYEAAADFAKRGAKVILACRDPNRGQTAENRIIKDTGNKNVFYKQLDLSSLKSVREFAEHINKTEERLDILVNNAGAGRLGSKKTADGLDLLMQVNYFGHFLLTNLLLDLVKKTSDSRIVNVSSIAAKFARNFDVNNLNQSVGPGFREQTQLYARSKLCNVLFTIELAKRLKGTSTTAFSLHPGAVLTNIFKSMTPVLKAVMNYAVSWFMKDSQEGAQTTIYCSVEQNIEYLTGHHFHDCHVVKRYKAARDSELPGQLWEVSEKLVNLN